MPLYDYECPECGATQCDVEQTLAEVEAGEAPVCWACVFPPGGHDPVPRKMVRVIAPVGFALKGGGWAKDGYTKSKGE